MNPHWRTTTPPVGTAIIVCLSEYEDNINAIVSGYIDPEDNLFHYGGFSYTDIDNIKGWYPVPEFV